MQSSARLVLQTGELLNDAEGSVEHSSTCLEFDSNRSNLCMLTEVFTPDRPVMSRHGLKNWNGRDPGLTPASCHLDNPFPVVQVLSPRLIEKVRIVRGDAEPEAHLSEQCRKIQLSVVAPVALDATVLADAEDHELGIFVDTKPMADNVSCM